MSESNKKMIVFHQLNDYSGSPKVLSMTINALLEHGYEIDLVTTKGGCLDLIKSPGLKTHTFPYRFTSNKMATLLRSAFSQVCMFYYGVKYGRGKKFLINTILPVGGAIAGKAFGKSVVYHYHENAIFKGLYYRIKAKIMLMLADKIICVSDYQKSFLPDWPNISMIPNALLKRQKDRLRLHTDDGFESREILMVSSLRVYKGVNLFARLADEMTDYKFTLVANATESEISDYFKSEKIDIPKNLKVFPKQSDVSPFYNKAGVLVNLSDKRYFVETFGLTVIEAMAAGVPTIVPDEGGVVELVDDGKNGFIIDVRDIKVLKDTILKVFSDKSTYESLSKNAFLTAAKYSEDIYRDSIIKVINNSIL